MGLLKEFIRIRQPKRLKNKNHSILFHSIQNAANQNSKCFDPNKNKKCDGTDYNQNTI